MSNRLSISGVTLLSYCMYMYVLKVTPIYSVRGVGTLTQVRGPEGSRCSILYSNMLDTCMIFGPTPYKGEGAKAPLAPLVPTPMSVHVSG